MPTPLVSVIIPAYNAEQFIEQTLYSALNQTYPNLEVIVVDDGSSDRTAAIVQTIAQIDDRVRLIQQRNAGVAAARNRAVQLAKGEWVAPIDADDIWLPENLEHQVRCMMQSSSATGVVYAWSFDIDEHNRATGATHAFSISGDVYPTLLCHYFLSNGSCSLIRKTSLEQVGLYQSRTNRVQGCEDWELYLRLAERYQFAVVPRFLVGYRKRFQSLSSDHSSMASQFTAEIWQPALAKYPHLKLMSKLSHSSFFLYLARQTDRAGQYQKTLFWLSQAIEADCFTPFLRPGFYILWFKSLLLKVLRRQKIAGFDFSARTTTRPSERKLVRLQETLAVPNEKRLGVQRQTILGNLLHQFIRIYSDRSSYWYVGR